MLKIIKRIREEYGYYSFNKFVFHRKSKPAIICPEEFQWCKHGILFRIDGLALINILNGRKSYYPLYYANTKSYINFTEEDFWNE